MKKLLLSLLSVTPLLGCSALAAPVTLNLFAGGLSILDSLLLIGIGLVVLGILFLCIAFLKPTAKKAEKIESVPNPHFLDNPQWNEDAEETEFAEPDEYPEEDIDQPTEEEIQQAGLVDEETESATTEDVETILEETPTPQPEEEIPAEDTPEEIEVAEPEEEKVYPKLILTNRETNDFMIIPLSGENTIGRKPENDLVLNDTTVSGRHCLILTEDEKVFMQDENSTNGTYVNGTRIFEKTELHPGDKISIGKQEFNISFHA